MERDDLLRITGGLGPEQIRDCQLHEHDLGCWAVRLFPADGGRLGLACAAGRQARELCAGIQALLKPESGGPAT